MKLPVWFRDYFELAMKKVEYLPVSEGEIYCELLSFASDISSGQQKALEWISSL